VYFGYRQRKKMNKGLIQKIETYVRITLEDIESINIMFELKSFRKNTIIQKEHSIPSHLYFIVSGHMRLFYTNDYGDEVTTRISKPNEFITPFLHFIHERRSKMNTECITDCEVLAISQQNLRKLIIQSPNMQEFSLVIFEEAIEMIEQRADDLATLDAEQRYRKLLKEHPSILQNVPLMQVASYLGMKPESLSRIRKKLTT